MSKYLGFIIGLLVIYIAYLHIFRISPEPEPRIVTVTTVRVDTVEITGPPRIIQIPVPSPAIVDTLYLDPPSCEELSLTRTYTSEVSDSLIEGTWVATVQGFLQSSEFTYTPKFPKYITNTVETTTTITKVITPKRYLSVGGFARFDAVTAFGVQAAYTTSNRRSLIYGYDLTTSSHQIGILIPVH